MLGDSTIPSALESALGVLRGLVGCTVDGRLTSVMAGTRWLVPLSLQIEAATEFVPAVTRWCLLVDQAYPFGSIEFYPAASGGITVTFPHQERNEPANDGRGWRTGKLCLDTPFRSERRPTAFRDPLGDADARLRWHVERALDWVEAAAEGRLLAVGDPYELPARLQVPLDEQKYGRVVHDETIHTFADWAAHYEQTGIARFGAIPGIDGVVAVTQFEDWQGNKVRQWMGRRVDAWAEELQGIWWLWSEPIILPPWQCPGSWGDLRKVGRNQGLDVDRALRRFASHTRGTKPVPLMLVGYPIPRHMGEAPSEVHWDVIELPRLRAAGGLPPDGFRSNSLGWWERDRTMAFADDKKLAYIRTENWSQERLQARGRLPPALRDARIAILGVGALGATIAEMIVRAGVKDVSLIDPDVITAGNICRHPTTLSDVGNTKVKAIASRLHQISPVVKVTEGGSSLPSDQQARVVALAPYDLLVDCTASDDVSLLLANAWWAIPRTFASFSLGYRGRRLFAFGVVGHQFPVKEFRDALAPWLSDEVASWSGDSEVLEGAGCWSPLFPARYDDIVLAAGVCVKELERLHIHHDYQGRLRVYEQQSGADGFDGFKLRVHPPVDTPVP